MLYRCIFSVINELLNLKKKKKTFELQLLRIKVYVNDFDLVKLRINRVRINSAC